MEVASYQIIEDMVQAAEVDCHFLGRVALVQPTHRSPAQDFSVDLENAINVGPTADVTLEAAERELRLLMRQVRHALESYVGTGSEPRLRIASH